MTGVLEVLGVPALVEWGVDTMLFGVEGFVAKMIVTGIVVIINYIVSKFFVFSDPWNRKNKAKTN